MRKVLLFVLAILASAGLASAQGVGTDFYAGLQYDVDNTGLYYCTTRGPIPSPQLIKTTGSSANLAPYVTGSGPFEGMAVGDVLTIDTGGGTFARRVVTTWTSANAIVVDAAIDLSAGSGFGFSYSRNVCGTAITDGWFAIPPAAQRVGMSVFFEQGDITTLAVRWECTHDKSAVVIVYPGVSSDCGLGGTLATDRCTWPQAKSGAADGSLTIVDDAPVYQFCRVGLAYVTADTSDATTNLEKITVAVSVR